MRFRNLAVTVFLVSISTTAFGQPQSSIPDVFEWYELGKAQELAAENDKKVLVYANARWCTYCKKMEKEVFTQEQVQQKTNENFYTVWIDIESEDSLSFRGKRLTQQQFAQVMRVTGTPTFIFFDEEGEIIAGQPGYIPEDLYVQILDFVGSDAYLDQSFGEFSGN